MANVAEVHVMSEPRSEHLTVMEVASYVDGVAPADVRRRLEAHLADCLECRDELVDAGRIADARTTGRRSIARFWVPATLAASLVLILVRPDPVRERDEYREVSVTTTVLPQAITPRGTVDSLPVLQWTSVPNADRYDVQLLSSDGTVVWEHATVDTAAAVPGSIGLRARTTYYWKVEAQLPFDRRAASERVEFTVRTSRRR